MVVSGLANAAPSLPTLFLACLSEATRLLHRLLRPVRLGGRPLYPAVAGFLGHCVALGEALFTPQHRWLWCDPLWCDPILSLWLQQHHVDRSERA